MSDGTQRSIDLAACLGLPEFSEARILAGGDDPSRLVSWVSVIEWPVEHFASPGDFVLTTGVGCDVDQLCEIVRQVGVAGASVVCISTGAGAIHEVVDPSVIGEAERVGIALIELPWRVRFSDVSRAVIQQLYRTRTSTVEALGGLSPEFTRALLGPSGIAGVADALEQVAGTPVVIMDAILTTVGSGERGKEWLSNPGVESAIVERIVTSARDARQPIAARMSAATPGPESGPPDEIILAPALVHDGVLGWVIVRLSPDSDRDLVQAAVLHAGTATAIELLRKVADDEAESRARESFFWEVARGSVDSLQELAARSVLLGLSLNSEFTVALGVVEAQETLDHSPTSVRAFVNQVRRRLTHPSSTIALNEQELLFCVHQQDAAELASAIGTKADASGTEISWGLASGTHNLTTLAQAVVQARTALSVVRALWGPGASGNADQLGAFMLLHHLVGDSGAASLVDATLGPLEEADRAKKSQLISTVSAYLETNGNISSAARNLYLNRHSLIYRLRRITELTGLDLDSHEDRLLLGVSLKIRQLQAMTQPTDGQGLPGA